MSLATRCPACQTVFRVVQDQLRVSEGWVRCGRCNEVFNAVEQMVDLARPESAAPPSAAAAAEVVEVSPDVPVRVHPAIDDTASEVADQAPAQMPADVLAAEGDGADAAVTSPGDEDAQTTVVEDDQRVEPSWSAEPAAAPVGAAIDDNAAAPALPTFVQAADRAARWQRPAVRRSLLAAAVLCALLLAVQASVEYRDLVAARWTATRPTLEALCRWSGCRIEPPRWIEALAVDSSGLVRVEGTNTYRFSVGLQNRSSMVLALPSIDLTLTDAQGRVIARRAFLASELGSTSSALGSGAELPLQATLSIAEQPVAGYTIEIFYP